MLFSQVGWRGKERGRERRHEKERILWDCIPCLCWVRGEVSKNYTKVDEEVEVGYRLHGLRCQKLQGSWALARAWACTTVHLLAMLRQEEDEGKAWILPILAAIVLHVACFGRRNNTPWRVILIPPCVVSVGINKAELLIIGALLSSHADFAGVNRMWMPRRKAVQEPRRLTSKVE